MDLSNVEHLLYARYQDYSREQDILAFVDLLVGKMSNKKNNKHDTECDKDNK